MQKNINEEAQRKRKKDAWLSAWISSVMMFLPSLLMLLLRWYYQIDGFWGAILLIMAVWEIAMIIPVWILLKKRLKEIEGGEEDAAAQY